jgi:CheY-like chemotaxis protein
MSEFHAGGPRILLAEDDPPARRLHVQILHAAGFEVVEAESGAELVGRLLPYLLRRALRRNGEHFDAVISDARMRDLDAMAAIQHDSATRVGTRVAE